MGFRFGGEWILDANTLKLPMKIVLESVSGRGVKLFCNRSTSGERGRWLEGHRDHSGDVLEGKSILTMAT